MWANKYIGIPFKANGRDETGLDCWGLVRLIYKNEFNIDLPSFSTDYEITDNDRISELIALYKEGWTSCAAPEPNSVVLFRILGELQHIGLVLDTRKFIHVRENSDVAIEDLNDIKWSRRIIGYYKYTPLSTDIILNAAPHPLKTEKINFTIPTGQSISQVYDLLQEKYSISNQLKTNIHIFLNGKLLEKELWDTTLVKPGDALEYRAVAQRGNIRMVLLLVVAVAAAMAGQWVAVEQLGYAAAKGFTAANFGAALAGAAAAAAVQVVGMKLIDTIAPIRQEDSTYKEGSKAQYLFTGGNNQYNRYGSIPVVLGKVRLTPPLGANTFVDYEKKNTSYLNLILVWGYGPLKFYEDTFQIGNKELNSFYEITMETITGNETPEEELDKIKIFNEIYPEDIEQVYLGNTLTWEGTPDPTRVDANGNDLDPDDTGIYNPELVSTDMQPVYIDDPGYYKKWFQPLTTADTGKEIPLTDIFLNIPTDSTKYLTSIEQILAVHANTAIKVYYTVPDTIDTPGWSNDGTGDGGDGG